MEPDNFSNWTIDHTVPQSIKALYTRETTVVAATFAVTFSVTGIIGNLGTICALLKCRKLRGIVTTWFVLSLCVSDFLFCIVNLPLTATRYIHEAWVFDETLCKLFPFFFYSNFGASLLNIMLIAINRYVLIQYNAFYDQLYKPLFVVLMITLIWILSFGLLTLPLLEIWGTLGLHPTSFSCTILKKNGTSPKRALFIFGILLPCLTITYCYLRIFLKVRRSGNALRKYQRSGPKTGSEANKRKQRRNDMRLTKMMFIIFATYIISFLPLMIFNVIDEEARRFPGYLHIFASILAWGSAVVNPVIYCISNRQYRQAYAGLFSCCRNSQVGDGVVTTKSWSGKTCTTDPVVTYRTTPSDQGKQVELPNSID